MPRSDSALGAETGAIFPAHGTYMMHILRIAIVVSGELRLMSGE